MSRAVGFAVARVGVGVAGGCRPQAPRFGLNGLVLKRRTGCECRPASWSGGAVSGGPWPGADGL